jgi:hypothetical protein
MTPGQIRSTPHESRSTIHLLVQAAIRVPVVSGASELQFAQPAQALNDCLELGLIRTQCRAGRQADQTGVEALEESDIPVGNLQTGLFPDAIRRAVTKFTDG